MAGGCATSACTRRRERRSFPWLPQTSPSPPRPLPTSSLTRLSSVPLAGARLPSPLTPPRTRCPSFPISEAKDEYA